MLRARTRPGIFLAAFAVLTACTDTTYILCDSETPGCVRPVAEITIVSSVDSVMALGRTARLSGTATDRRGGTIPDATLSWSSTDPSIAIVDLTGLIAGRSAGTTDIVATAGGVSGVYSMRVVEVDLDTVERTLTEPLVLALWERLDPPAAARLGGVLSSCFDALDAGHVLAIDACLSDASSTSATSGQDAALLGVLRLFFVSAQRQMRLEE